MKRKTALEKLMTEPVNGTLEVAPAKMHNLTISNDELFALNCLVNLTVAGINWQGQGIDPDQMELRFRQGKIGLKAKVALLALEAEPNASPS